MNLFCYDIFTKGEKAQRGSCISCISSFWEWKKKNGCIQTEQELHRNVNVSKGKESKLLKSQADEVTLIIMLIQLQLLFILNSATDPSISAAVTPGQ